MFVYEKRKDIDIELLIRRNAGGTTTREYNADLTRLLPWPERVNTKRKLTEFGVILVSVQPYENVDAHRHDEEECFIVVSGQANLIVEDKGTKIGAGDVVCIPRFWMHQIKNPFHEKFEFVDIYWDNRQRNIDEYRQSLLESEIT